MSESTTITITRQVPAAPQRAFDAWVDPAELARWWWPQWPDTTYEVDAHEGGRYRFHSAAVGMGVTGEFHSFDPPRGFAMSWVWISEGTPAEADGAPVVDLVEVTFSPLGSGTEVTVRHTSTEHIADGGAEQGWNDVLDRLPAYLAS